MSTRARRRLSLASLMSSRRRLAWVFALALLLPFAQAVAWAHALGHHSTATQRVDSGAAGQFDGSCAACLSAAPLHSGGLPAAQAVVLDPPLEHAPPPVFAAAAHRHANTLAYRSRAPPPLT
jgi:hypothetical protein